MSYHWNWGVFSQHAARNQTYLDWLLSGALITLGLGLASWAIALGVGTVLGVLRTVPNKICSGLAATYVQVFRNVPLLVQLFIWYFVMPDLLPLGDAFKHLTPIVQQFLAAVLCLGTFTAARVCELVRSGILALPPGQKDAGLALGLTLTETYRFVLLPMSLRIVVPPLTSELLNVFKNSAVASTIGLLELTAQGRQLVDYTAQPYESFIAVTLIYLCINTVVMSLMHWVERRARIPGHLGGR
jgi:glutamate/aspartate transport system permease protein